MPRKAFRDATALVEPFDSRNAISSSATHMVAISDQAYFYAGLAFGITLMQFGVKSIGSMSGRHGASRARG